MAELVEVVEPNERQYLVKLKESEVLFLKFLFDIIDDPHAAFTYQFHYMDEISYNRFNENGRDIVQAVSDIFKVAPGYGDVTKYIEAV